MATESSRWSWSIGRTSLVQSVRAAVAVMIVIVVALILVGSLTVMQGQRDESRNVDAIILVLPETVTDDDPQLAHAFELYRRGYAPRVVLTGPDPEAGKAHLVERGLPDNALLLLEDPGETAWGRLYQATDLVQQQGLESVLLVNASHRMLLDMKMTRDLGLTAYGSPPEADFPGVNTLLRASMDYWKYVLLGPG